MDELIKDNKAIFIHFGKDKCPHCGAIGNEVKDSELRFLECPLCNTKYTNEIVLHKGSVENEMMFDNN